LKDGVAEETAGYILNLSEGEGLLLSVDREGRKGTASQGGKGQRATKAWR